MPNWNKFDTDFRIIRKLCATNVKNVGVSACINVLQQRGRFRMTFGKWKTCPEMSEYVEIEVS